MANQANGDLGNGWLKTRTAGAGPVQTDRVGSERSRNHRHQPACGRRKALTRRIVLRHVADPSAQLLLLQKGDVDIARELGSDQLKSLAGDKNLTVTVGATRHLDVHRDEPGDA